MVRVNCEYNKNHVYMKKLYKKSKITESERYIDFILSNTCICSDIYIYIYFYILFQM